MVKTGIFTKRGVERKTYEVVPSEAEIVRKMFDLFTEEGYGSIRIAKYLNEKGYKTHKGLDWSYSTVNNMLRNPIYTGYLCFHKTSVPVGGGKRKRVVNKEEWFYSKEKIPEFQIISEEQFEKAQKIKASRKAQNEARAIKNQEYFKYQTKGELLFSGYAICGGCGSKLYMRSSKRKIKLDDGTDGYTRYNYYSCTNNICGRVCSCKQKTHKSNTVEAPVLNEIYKYFDLLEKRDLSEYVKKIHEKTQDNEDKKIKELEKDIKDCYNKNDLLKDEIMNIIVGKSSFSREMITELMEENKKKINRFQAQLEELKGIKKQKDIKFEQMIAIKNMIPNWKEIFQNCSIERKKMLLSAIIKEVVVYDEKIDVHLKIGFDEFMKTVKKLNFKQLENKNSFVFENISNSGTHFTNTNV